MDKTGGAVYLCKWSNNKSHEQTKTHAALDHPPVFICALHRKLSGRVKKCGGRKSIDENFMLG